MYQWPNIHPIAWFTWEKWEICLHSKEIFLLFKRLGLVGLRNLLDPD